jgi:hypothetical protein
MGHAPFATVHPINAPEGDVDSADAGEVEIPGRGKSERVEDRLARRRAGVWEVDLSPACATVDAFEKSPDMLQGVDRLTVRRVDR